MLEPISVTVDVPAAVAGGRSPEALAAELRRLVVLDAFRRGEIGSGKGGRLLGIGRVEFIDLCAHYQIPTIQYGPGELEQELASIRTLGY